MAADRPARGRPRWRLHEPTTVLTDVALTVAGVWCAARLAGLTDGAAPLLLAGAFLLLAASALLGAVVHGVGPSLGDAVSKPIWKVTLLLALLTNALLLGAEVVAHVAGAWRGLLLALVGAKLVAASAAALRQPVFRWIVYDSLATFAAVAAIEAIAWGARGAPSAPWMLGAVALSMAAGALQHFRVAPHRHFNHNDLYHVVQLAAILLFYRGGLLLAPR